MTLSLFSIHLSEASSVSESEMLSVDESQKVSTLNAIKRGESIYVEMKDGSVYSGKFLNLDLVIENNGIQVSLKYGNIKTATYLIPSEVRLSDGEIKIPPVHTD